jgi:hypothetical protein
MRNLRGRLAKIESSRVPSVHREYERACERIKARIRIAMPQHLAESFAPRKARAAFVRDYLANYGEGGRQAAAKIVLKGDSPAQATQDIETVRAWYRAQGRDYDAEQAASHGNAAAEVAEAFGVQI